MVQKISRLYDSHVHFAMTGELKQRLNLSQLKSSEDLWQLPISKNQFQGDWLVGFGWDEYQWPEKDQNLNKIFLDKIFPDYPVLFSRKDGHKAWVNSKAIQHFPEIEHRDGILLENAHYALLRKIPFFSKEQIRSQILQTQDDFLKAGFTHLRDLSTSFNLLDVLSELEQEGKFKIFFKANFVCDQFKELEDLIEKIIERKNKQNQASKIQIQGVKLFYDGSLGSETALLSRKYPSQKIGIRLWNPVDLEKSIEKIWRSQLDVSIHVIGDQAVDEVVDIARKISSRGISGNLNLEHVQVVRPETISKMKGLHITCHMQPCHFLSDRLWLNEKLGELIKFAFPWESLRRAKIPLHFGSDSPIEVSSVFNNIRAIKSAESFGISKLNSSWITFHTAPVFLSDLGEKETFTLIDEDQEKVSEVWVVGKQVF